MRNPFERCFEDYLRRAGVPFLAVEDAVRARVGAAGRPLKNFDYLVFPEARRNLIVEVKGKRCALLAGRAGRPARLSADNWVGEEDLESLHGWKQLFGADYDAALVYVFELPPECEAPLVARDGGVATPPGPPPGLPGTPHLFEAARYLLAAVSLARYLAECRVRSTRWLTQSLPRAAFSTAAAPLAEYLS